MAGGLPCNLGNFTWPQNALIAAADSLVTVAARPILMKTGFCLAEDQRSITAGLPRRDGLLCGCRPYRHDRRTGGPARRHRHCGMLGVRRPADHSRLPRSEERRVGKEWRARWWPERQNRE